MGIIKRAGDLVYTFRFLRLLTTKFEDTEAFKLGIIDKDGKRLKSYDLKDMDNRSNYKEYYTPFHRLVFNIKKLLAKAPGGDTRLASYAAALYLLKENFGVNEGNIKKGLQKLNIDITDILGEGSTWFLLEDQRLSPGYYRIKHDKVLSESLDEIARRKDSILVQEDAYPVGSIFGLNIYEAVHKNTKKKIHITIDELLA
tara:strand:- start:2578 stop:3177 length:600 start_codon:yes stop_codon:yes gene_type:complete